MSMQDDADQVSARIDAEVREAERRAEDATRFRRTTQEVRGRASDDGVTATVDASGALIALELPRDLRFRGGESLARTILTAVRKAYADAAGQVELSAIETFGASSPIVGRVQGELGARASLIAPDPGEAGPGVLR